MPISYVNIIMSTKATSPEVSLSFSTILPDIGLRAASLTQNIGFAGTLAKPIQWVSIIYSLGAFVQFTDVQFYFFFFAASSPLFCQEAQRCRILPRLPEP